MNWLISLEFEREKRKIPVFMEHNQLYLFYLRRKIENERKN